MFNVSNFRKLKRGGAIVFIIHYPQPRKRKNFHGHNLDSPNLRVKIYAAKEFDEEWMKKEPQEKEKDIQNSFKSHDFYNFKKDCKYHKGDITKDIFNLIQKEITENPEENSVKKKSTYFGLF